MVTFRLILALATQYGWDVDHMEVVMAILNPRIDETTSTGKCHLELTFLHQTEARQTEACQSEARPRELHQSEVCQTEARGMEAYRMDAHQAEVF